MGSDDASECGRQGLQPKLLAHGAIGDERLACSLPWEETVFTKVVHGDCLSYVCKTCGEAVTATAFLLSTLEEKLADHVCAYAVREFSTLAKISHQTREDKARVTLRISRVAGLLRKKAVDAAWSAEPGAAFLLAKLDEFYRPNAAAPQGEERLHILACGNRAGKASGITEQLLYGSVISAGILHLTCVLEADLPARHGQFYSGILARVAKLELHLDYTFDLATVERLTYIEDTGETRRRGRW